MARGEKTAETYKKVADYFTKKGNKKWAKAKQGEGGFNYKLAKDFYETAKKASNKIK